MVTTATGRRPGSSAHAGARRSTTSRSPPAWRPWRNSRRQFEVTASTIRRDLALLNGQGRLARTYGGAMALGAHPEASLRQRTGEALRAEARDRPLGGVQ